MLDWALYGKAALTAIGFFWKAGWAFVLGYLISAMIQAFVPKSRLTRHMGKANVRSISLSTAFGSISSSCSFAALATARSLVLKGAHFICAVAFMFASTNLVIELGILIWIFLGWPYLVAEIIGGLVLIAISSLLIRLTYPASMLSRAREQVEDRGGEETQDFDWRERLRSWSGWGRVGHHFVMEWAMVWREILVGFTVAGFIATFVPDTFWKSVFLHEAAQQNPNNPLIVLENAMIAPLVAACTFIGSMGNIPLATVLNTGGVLFGGIMAFIYSDLMVPPLVKVNARYYGWRTSLYIAGIMYVSIVISAILLHYGFAMTGWTPKSSRNVESLTQFAFDYTFFMNITAVGVVAVMLILYGYHRKENKASHRDDSHAAQGEETGEGGHDHHGDQDESFWSVQNIITYAFIAILAGGVCSALISAS